MSLGILNWTINNVYPGYEEAGANSTDEVGDVWAVGTTHCARIFSLSTYQGTNSVIKQAQVDVNKVKFSDVQLTHKSVLKVDGQLNPDGALSFIGKGTKLEFSLKLGHYAFVFAEETQQRDIKNQSLYMQEVVKEIASTGAGRGYKKFVFTLGVVEANSGVSKRGFNASCFTSVTLNIPTNVPAVAVKGMIASHLATSSSSKVNANFKIAHQIYPVDAADEAAMSRADLAKALTTSLKETSKKLNVRGFSASLENIQHLEESEKDLADLREALKKSGLQTSDLTEDELDLFLSATNGLTGQVEGKEDEVEEEEEEEGFRHKRVKRSHA